MHNEKIEEIESIAPMPKTYNAPEIVWDVVLKLMLEPATLEKAEDLVTRYIKTFFSHKFKSSYRKEDIRWVNSTTMRIFPHELNIRGPEVLKKAVDNLNHSLEAQMLACCPTDDAKYRVNMAEAVGVKLRNIGDSFTVTIKLQFSWCKHE